MSADPVLHLLARPNGAGKTTYASRVLQPVTHLPFVNADEASRLAARERAGLIAARSSFITETVFSHESKVDLGSAADAAGFYVHLHVILVPEDTTVGRVEHRVQRGGHDVPEAKIRQRYHRLWALVAQARELAERPRVYDNSLARAPFCLVATYQHGQLIGEATWPTWTPPELRWAPKAKTTRSPRVARC